jgi:ankyrin repeat protein
MDCIVKKGDIQNHTLNLFINIFKMTDICDICLQDDVKKLNLIATNKELKGQVNKKTVKGYTPLHLAAYAGKHQAVKVLCEQGADPNIKVRKLVLANAHRTG